MKTYPLSLDDLPAVFSSFRRKVEKNMHIRSLLSSPESMSCSWKSKTELPTLASLGFEECSTDERAVLDFKGGAKEAKKWMHQWIWERDCLKGVQGNKKRTGGGGLFIQIVSLVIDWMHLCSRRCTGKSKSMRMSGWPMTALIGYSSNYSGGNFFALLPVVTEPKYLKGMELRIRMKR
jgi:hypothetical protein